ncbi:MAG: hypothetical protein IJH20_02040 [Bacilli bacterium]|nr:hypothetical protein [Bacilli bacterium]
MTEEQIMTIRSRYNTIIGESTNHDEKFYSNTIRGIISETYIEEENSSHVLCYMGSYKMEKTDKGFEQYLSFTDDYDYDYRKYIDVETDKIYDINRNNVKEFEEKNLIVFPVTSICNMQEFNKAFLRIKKEYFLSLIYNGKNKTLKKVTNEDFK